MGGHKAWSGVGLFSLPPPLLFWRVKFSRGSEKRNGRRNLFTTPNIQKLCKRPCILVYYPFISQYLSVCRLISLKQLFLFFREVWNKPRHGFKLYILESWRCNSWNIARKNYFPPLPSSNIQIGRGGGGPGGGAML